MNRFITILLTLCYLNICSSYCQEIIEPEEAYDAIENYDTLTLTRYFAAGGSIDAEFSKILGSELKQKKDKKGISLFEQSIAAISEALEYNLEKKIPLAYRNLDILLSHLDESEKRQEHIDRTFNLAISTSDVELVRKISQLGADINHPCHLCYGRPPILIAIAYNQDLELIKFLLSLKPDLTILDYSDRGCLHYAAMGGSIELFSYLLNYTGMDINTADSYGATPIFYAAQGGHVDLYNYLLRHGAKTDFELKSGENLLHAAALSGNTDFFRLVYHTSGIPVWSDGLFALQPYTYASTEEIELFIKRTSLLEKGHRFTTKKIRKSKFQRIFRY
jgi:hypothetical protein